jgi:hypothetical protein
VPTRLRHLPTLWAVALALLLLGPALGVGYVLSYDMVWVPHLALRSDFLGFSTALPRAVPSDAVVAVLDDAVPAMLLQKAALLGSLVAAALGMARLVGDSLAARLTAVTLTVWNPFTVERLVIGHWTVLVGYGVLPWLVLAGRATRRTGRVPVVAWVLVPLGSLSATAGLVSALALVVSGWRSPRAITRSDLTLLLCALVGNAPWLAAGLLHLSAATGPGASVFALHPEGSLPAPLAGLGMGGIWNADVVPGSRHTFLAWLSLAVLIALAAVGARTWRERTRGESARLLALWGLGYLLALVTWLLPGVTDALAAHVPGGGLLRDGTRIFALCLPVYAGLPAAGAEWLTGPHAGLDAAGRRLVVGTVVALPVLLLYDAAWGVSGALRAVDYPASWAAARAGADLSGGDLLVLPFSAYRAPDWNHRQTVLDPLGRYLRPDYLANDGLVVDNRTVPGEDPRVAEARTALALPTPEARTRALLALGIRNVATETDTPGPGRHLSFAADPVSRGAGLVVVRLQGTPVERTISSTDRAVMAVAWAAYAGSFVVGMLVLGLRGLRSTRHRWRARAG